MKISVGKESCFASPQSAFHSSVLEHSCRFGASEADIVRYEWNHPTVDNWVSSTYFVDMPLTPRPQPNWAIYRDGRQCRQLPLDRIWFMPPGRTVESGAGVGWQRSLHLSLDAKLFQQILQTEPDWSDFSSGYNLYLWGTGAERLLTQMCREIRQPGFASEIVVEALATAVAALIVRACRLDKAQRAEPSRGGLSPWRMRRLRERVQADMAVPHLEELAELCGLSVRHLSRAFKAETGQTIARYVQQATIERAYAKLADPDLSVAELAQSLGFASATSFAFAFRRETGLSPSDVRRGR